MSTRASASVGLAAHHAPLDPPEAARLAADVDVLGDREVRAEVHFLVDGADAPALRLVRAREEHAPPVELDRAAVDLVRPGQHLEQGRLAGAVLPEQRVHFAGEEAEVDTVERLHARERLLDAGHLEDRRGGGGGSGCHLVRWALLAVVPGAACQRPAAAPGTAGTPFGESSTYASAAPSSPVPG